jgi:hypothetical protein
MAAMTVGLVFMMTGCSPSALTGDALYQAAAGRYYGYAADMHLVLMAVHEGDWAVDQGAYGAAPSSCQIGADEFGYFFDYARTVTIEQVDAEALSAAAVAAFKELGLEIEVATFGEGEAQEQNIVATGGNVGRAVVTIRPATGWVRVIARPECEPGVAADLSEMVFGGDVDRGAALRVPATEGVDSIPQFYFPADGPLFYDEDGTPILPQPVVTEVPEAPYGDDTP